jgi:hypothetical protein
MFDLLVKKVNDGIIAITWHTSTSELLLKGKLSTVDLLVKIACFVKNSE